MTTIQCVQLNKLRWTFDEDKKALDQFPSQRKANKPKNNKK